MSLKKLYIVTGKGGVGKSMTALALTKALQNQTSKNVYYNCFDLEADKDLCKELGIKTLEFSVTESTTEYIGRKLGSKSIASWVMKAPFFKALFNIVPSLGNMITLGHLIDILEKSDDKIIVVDAPSSGHILTVLESPKNFNQIFKTGALVKDIHRMLGFMQDSDLVETWVLNIPTELAVTEGRELIAKLKDSGISNIKDILNNALSRNDEITQEELPDFLSKKVEIETEVIDNSNNNFDQILPMFFDKSPKELVKRIEEKIKL
jgi:arsenite-transporting ATPase